MKKGTYSSKIFLLTLGLFCFYATSAQVTMQPLGNGAYDFISTFDQSDLHLYFYGDGYYSFEHSPYHEYHSSNVPTSATVYHVEPYDDSDVDDYTVGTPNSGSNAPNVPLLNFSNIVEVTSSWNPVFGKNNYLILMLQNNFDPNPIKGEISFYYDQNTAAINVGDILDDYNNWFSNGTVLPSDDGAYTHRIVWSVQGLNYNEQRFIYVPMTCLAELNETVSVKVCAGYDEGTRSNSGSFCSSHVYAVTSYPHDPNEMHVTNKDELEWSSELKDAYGDHGQVLRYSIFFYNDGEGTARDVEVHDYLDPEIFDIESVVFNGKMRIGPWYKNDVGRMAVRGEVSTIGELQSIVDDGKRVFSFPSLQLEPNMGAIFEFDVRVHKWVNPQDCISNRADVYFDDLEPVSTNVSWICSPADNRKNDQNELMEVEIHPNPVTDDLIIDITTDDNYTIDIYGQRGKLIRSIQNCRGEKLIDMIDFPAGIYIINITSFNHSISEKVAKF